MSSIAVKWSTWTMLTLFYAYQFVSRIIPNIVVDNIAEKYEIDAGKIGSFAGIYYIGYIIMHIPLGIIVEHFNVKKVVPICIIVTVIGFTPLLYSKSFTLAYYGRLFVGLGSAGATVSAFKLLRLLFGKSKFPKMLGWMGTIGLLGAIFGSGPLSKFVLLVGWVSALNYILIFGLALSFFSYFIIPNTQSNTEFNINAIKNDFKYLLANKVVILIAILGGLMIGPLEGFADMWSNKYLITVFKIDNQIAGNITQFIYIGMSVGLVVTSYIFEKTKLCYSLLLTKSLLMLISFLLMVNNLVQNNIILLKLLYYIIGFSCSYQILIISKAVILTNGRSSTFVSSIVNMVMMCFGFSMHITIGKLLNYFSEVTINNISTRQVYTIYSFHSSLIIIPICLALASIGLSLLILKEKRNKKYPLKSCLS